MTGRSRLGGVVVALALQAAAGPTALAQRVEIEVAIMIGATRVPLGVWFHFRDVASTLPQPGHLPVEDAHDRKHGAQTFCYSHRTPQGYILLEMFDSDFGLHTARVSRANESGIAKCAPLPSEPMFVVGDLSYSLSNGTFNAPPEFEIKERDDTLSFEREWRYWDEERPHMWGSCFYRSVSVVVEKVDGNVRSIRVQNWEEPDSC